MSLSRRWFPLLGVLLVVAFAALAAFTRSGGGESASGSPVDAAAEASALAGTPAFKGGDAADTDSSLRLLGDSIVKAAAAAQAITPFPEGATDKFDWANFEGAISPEGVSRITQIHSACAWSAALLARTDPAGQKEARDVLAVIPKWPAFAASQLGEGPRAVADALTSGDQSVTRAYLQSC